MAGKPLSADLVREILRLHIENKSNREIARLLKPPINKATVNRYIGFVRNNGLDPTELLRLGDAELDRVFHKGDPAYTEPRMDDFIGDTPIFELERREPGMSVYRMWRNYRGRHRDGYELTQFRFHLSQASLLPVKTPAGVPNTDCEVSWAIAAMTGFTTQYTKPGSDKAVSVAMVAMYTVPSGYTRVVPVLSHGVTEVAKALDGLFNKLGGVPRRLATSELQKVCAREDKRMPSVRNIFKEMAAYYGFETAEPPDKGASARARKQMDMELNHLNHTLSNRAFLSLAEICATVSLFEDRYNRTRVRGKSRSREDDFIRTQLAELGRLPDVAYEVETVSKHKVHNDGTIELTREGHAGFYSVPVAYIGRSVTCHCRYGMVSILDGDELVAEHRMVGPYRYSVQETHLRDWLPSEYNDANMRIIRARQLLGALGAWMEGFFNETVNAGHPVLECFRKCEYLEHLAYSDLGAMNTACNTCIRRGSYKYPDLKKAYELCIKTQSGKG